MSHNVEPVYIPTGNPDTVNAANYAPGEVGKTYGYNRKRYQIALLDATVECTVVPFLMPETKAQRDAREAREAARAKETKPKTGDPTDVGPVLAGQVAYWKDRLLYIATNAPRAVVPPEEEEEEEEKPTAPTGPTAPQPGARPPVDAPKPPAKPPNKQATTTPKTRTLRVAGIFGTAVTPGSVCHLQQRGLAKLRVPEGLTLAEDSLVSVDPKTGALASGTKENAIGTTIGEVKDGFVLVDLEIASAE